MRKILIVKTTSMGDIVHALPAASDIARHFPGVRIDWVSEESFAGIARLSSVVSTVHTVAFRRWRKTPLSRATFREIGDVRRRLAAENYDAVIDLQGLIKSAWVARWTKVPAWGYDAASIKEPLASRFYAKTFAVSRQEHAIVRCRKLAALAFGYDYEDAEPVYGIDVKGADDTRNVLFIPNTSRDEKLWDEANWVRLGESLVGRGFGLKILWGSQAEHARARRLGEALGDSCRVMPRMGFEAIAHLMANADAVIGLDTGLMHLAVALGRPAIGIYTGTPPELTGLYGKNAVSLGARNASPSVSEVFDAAGRFLKCA